MKRVIAFLSAVFVLLTASAAVASPPAAPAPAPVVKQSAVAGAGVQYYGDSLTAGNNDHTFITIPGQLQQLWGVPVPQNGIGGQTSTQILLRTGVPFTLSVSGNVLNWTGPTSGNVVTAINGVAPVGMNTTQSPDYRMLSTVGDDAGRIMRGTLCGFNGYLQRMTTSGTVPSTAEPYAFFPNANNFPTGGNAACPGNSTFTPEASALLSQPAIIEWGRNNIPYPAQVQADVQAYITAMGHKRYLVMSIPNGDFATEQTGQSGYNSIIALNSALASIAGPKNYWDVRAYLVSQYNPANPVDVLNHTNDVVPYTLRAVNATGTLAAAISDTSTCAISLSTAPSVGQTLKVDSEFIYISAISGNNVTGCTRGYGTGGVAATHSNGAAISLTDGLHWGSNAIQLIANYIYANYTNVLFAGQSTAVVTPQSVGKMLLGPITLGSPTVQGDINLLYGTLRITPRSNGCMLSSNYTNSGFASNYPMCIMSYDTTNTITLCAYFCNAVSVSSGAGGTAWTVPNNGDTQFFHAIEDRSYSYSTPTTGTTVTIADTSDLAIINPAGTLAALTLTLPTCSSAYDGKLVGATFTQAITSLTVSATAGTVTGAPPSASANTSLKWICRGSNSTYYVR